MLRLKRNINQMCNNNRENKSGKNVVYDIYLTLQCVLRILDTQPIHNNYIHTDCVVSSLV